MPYPQPFMKLTIFGRLGSTTSAETWSTTVKFGFLSDATDPTDFLPAAATPIAGFFTQPATGSGGRTYLTELHGAIIGTDGKYVGGAEQATKVYTFSSPPVGQGTGANPWPTSTVISLRATGRTRGPGSHGRMFWPAVGQTVGLTDGRYPPLTTMAADARVMLNTLNTLAKTHFGPGTCIINTSPRGGGVIQAVNQILLGNRPDHQERRENAFAESYVTQSITI